jgi:glycosyltransferase involved in cell wall biosynthesis
MKIAFDVSYVQHRRAGLGRYAVNVLDALLEYDRTNEYVLHGWSFGIDSAAIAARARARVSLSIGRIPGQFKRLYWNRIRFPSIEAFCGVTDIFHSMDPLLPRTTSAKTICTVHDIAYKKFPHLFEARVPAWDLFVKRSLRVADAIIVLSEHTKADLQEHFDVEVGKISVVPIPPAPIFHRSQDKNSAKGGREKPYLLYVGTIEPRKNIISIIKAFEILRQQQTKDVELVIAGKRGWLYDDVFEAIRSSPFSSSIHYLDFVSDEELARLYRSALAFVFPSHYEGFGSPIVEAMASGTPIITSNNSSLREIADGVALLVTPTAVDELAEAMRLLVEDEVRRVEMRQRGLQVVQRFTPEATAKAILRVYNSLAQ